MELLTAAEMRAIETRAMAAGRANGLDLMERAGSGVVEAIFDTWPGLATGPHRAALLCGPGNNGGDGYVIARLLRDRGWRVDVFAMGVADTMPPDARANRLRWVQAGGAVAPLENASLARADLVVDAIFGTGLSRGFAPPAAIGAAFQAAFTDRGRRHDDGQSPRFVAVDIPSGLESDSGRMLAVEGAEVSAIAADLTVTFHAPKHGHMLAEGPARCGRLAVADIGVEGGGAVRLARPPVPSRGGPSLKKDVDGVHKYAHGHALVVSGGMGRTGAARLAARAALRIGAGLVTLAAPADAMPECAAHLTAVMLRQCGGAAGLDHLLEDARFNALCLGPGLGLGAETRELVFAALRARRPVVLDADALTAFAENPDSLFPSLHPQAVLTPHGGEFARLFPDLAERLQGAAFEGPAFSKIDATCAASTRAGCPVLFKGADTVIAAPDGRAVVQAAAYDRAAPWLATAGSGDVLAGMITGLLARRFDALPAAEAAAWLHVEAARAFGPGLIAEDLPEILPQVFGDIGLEV